MKRLLFALCLYPLLLGCSNHNKKVEEDIALVNNYVAAVENLDYDAMSRYLDDNYIGVGPSYGDTIRKEQVIAYWKDNIKNLYEKIKYERSKTIAVVATEGPNKGEWVSNWALLKIDYKENRGSVTLWANTVYQVENGKIFRSFTFYNEADAMSQLGYVFLHPDDL